MTIKGIINGNEVGMTRNEYLRRLDYVRRGLAITKGIDKRCSVEQVRP